MQATRSIVRLARTKESTKEIITLAIRAKTWPLVTGTCFMDDEQHNARELRHCWMAYSGGGMRDHHGSAMDGN